MPIISPGNQESNADGAIELRIAADIDETTGCTFSATGLPDGLEFERKKFEDDEEHTWQTGRIIGTPKRAGIYQVTVTAIDKAGTKTTASFVWTVCAMRAYRFALDLSDPQITAMQQHAGTARWAYNKALEAKVNAHRAYTERLKALLASGLTPQQAKAQMKKESAALKAQTAIWEHHRQCLTAMNLGRALPAKTPRGPQELIDDLAAIRAMVPDGVDPALLTLVGNWKGQPPTALCWARDRHEARQKWIKTHLVMARQTVTHLKQQLFDLGDTIPNMIENLANWRNTRDLPKEEGGSPWWQEVSSYVFSGGMGRADAAWSNWLKSLSGQRAGKAVGYPRFKKRGQCADSFPLFHDVTNPSIRIEGYRHLRLPNIGEVRVHNSGHRSGTRNRVTATNAKGVKRTVSGQSKGRLGSTKRLVRMIERGDAIVQSVTVVRGGHRWYANVLVKLTPEAMRQREMVARAHQKVSKKRAQGRGNVGVEWGVRTLATLSNGESFANPKPGKKNQRRLRVASQKVSRKPHKRGQPISANRAAAIRQLGRVHHEIAETRKGNHHQISAAISLGYRGVAVRGLDVKSMTKSAKGTVEKPGKHVKVKSTFNRAALDAAPGMLQNQISYKTTQYGAKFGVAPKDLPSSQTCSACGWRDPSIPLTQMTFRCGNVECGKKIDREVNAARNIRNSVFPVASDSGDTLNACVDGIGPPGSRGQPSPKQEDPEPHPPPEDGPAEGHSGEAIPRRSHTPG